MSVIVYPDAEVLVRRMPGVGLALERRAERVKENAISNTENDIVMIQTGDLHGSVFVDMENTPAGWEASIGSADFLRTHDHFQPDYPLILEEQGFDWLTSGWLEAARL